MTDIKERPILFSAPMVRAILEGRKTVTRRTLKQQPQMVTDRAIEPWAGDAQVLFQQLQQAGRKCPYGKPGDRLWVREAWARIGIAQAPDQEWVVYRESDNRTDYGGPWKPGIHMFRRDSRILLEIIDVRVERLQDITPAQVTAEGVSTQGEALWGGEWWVDAPDQAIEDARKDFADLWTSTGGDWSSNQWVWVVEFKRVTP
jgi:hypothetical protein